MVKTFVTPRPTISWPVNLTLIHALVLLSDSTLLPRLPVPDHLSFSVTRNGGLRVYYLFSWLPKLNHSRKLCPLWQQEHRCSNERRLKADCSNQKGQRYVLQMGRVARSRGVDPLQLRFSGALDNKSKLGTALTT